MRLAGIIIGVAGATLVGLISALANRGAAEVGVSRTIVVGQNPTLVATDSRTDRVFLLDDGSLARNAGGGIVEGDIHILDARTGALLRTVPAGTNPDAIAVDERTDRVFVLNSYMHNGGSGTVTVLDARTGRVVRTTHVGGAPVTLALDAGASHVFVLNQSNGVVTTQPRFTLVSVLDAAGGRLIGGLNPSAGAGLALGTGSLALDVLHHWAFLPVIGSRGALFIDVFDTRSDALVRGITLGHAAGSAEGSSVVVSAVTGRAFVLATTRMLVLDTSSWRVLRLNRPIYGLPIVDEHTGRLFLAEQGWNPALNAPNWGRTEVGALHILDARTGIPVGTMPMEWPDALAVDPRTGRLLILHDGPMQPDGSFGGAGHVDVRDGVTGRLVRAIAVGVAPVALTVDQRTGRALVVNAGGAVRQVDPWGWLRAGLRQRIPLLPAPPPATRNVASSVSVVDLGS